MDSNLASYSRYELIHLATHQFYKDVPEKVLKKRMSRKDREALHELLQEERKAGCIESPDDPDCRYRNKGGQKVRGYSANVTETCSDDQLNMITDIQLDAANTQDSTYLKEAIIQSKEVTGELADKVHCDGAYHSPTNTIFSKFCQLDLVLTGMHGKAGRYDLRMIADGLRVTDLETGEIIKANKVVTPKEVKWRVKTPTCFRYFTHKHIDNVLIREALKNRSREELNRRNNVEATGFVFGHSCIKGKSRYRKLLPNRAWAYTRGLSINIKRICKYIETTCQRTPAIASLPDIFYFLFFISFFRTFTPYVNNLETYSS